MAREKFWTIIYADDIVLLAKSEQKLKGLKRFRKYIERKELLLNPEKSKVMVFKRGRGRKSKRKWK